MGVLFKNLSVSIFLSFIVLGSTVFSPEAQAKKKSDPNDPIVWDKKDLREFEKMMKEVTKDVKEFFKENPDVIADNFGGLAYNFFQSLKEWKLDTKAAVMDTVNFYLDLLGVPVPPPKDGLARLCESPRICQGLQYLVASSIVEHSEGSSRINYYFVSSDSGGHNFIGALPKGVPPTSENLRIQGIIIDPWPYQTAEPGWIVFPGNNPFYKDSRIDIDPINHEKLVKIYGVNPFTTQPLPPPPVCNEGIFKTDSAGNYVYAPNASGQLVAVMNDVVGVAMVVAVNSVVKFGVGYTLTSKCDWEKNGQTYLSDALAVFPGYKQAGYNCVGVYSFPSGTLTGTPLPTTMNSFVCP